MCQMSINPEHFNFGNNLDLIGGKYFVKIIFDIIWAVSIWLNAGEDIISYDIDNSKILFYFLIQS